MMRSANSSGAIVPGACFCGAVRFEVTLPTTFCVHCHCTMCRRIQGAAFVTWFGVPKPQLRVVRGEQALSHHRSSEHGVRSFCARCGTPLFCELARYPDTIDITLASMEGAIDRAPQAHTYFSDHVDWLDGLDQLPKIEVE